MDKPLESLISEIKRLPDYQLFGRVTSIRGLLAECSGLDKVASIGSRCTITARDGRELLAEIVGFNDNVALLMPFAEWEGVGPGCKVSFNEQQSSIFPHERWMGRVVNALGKPVDGKGGLVQGEIPTPFRNIAPPAHARRRVGKKLDLGVRALNAFLSCCRGQRMGIFAGSGVGKSMMLAMLTRFSEADVKVIGLIGERGRELQEFIEDYLGKEGLAKAVVVVATSDESPLMRRQAGYTTLAIAEYFRNQGKEVLCLMDSVTRFAMAQREIGLSAGEPPTSKGYPPTVFSELPKLLERAGPGTEGQGDITGLFSVLVEGDDHNEPIADAVRGILDGHIVLEREIAMRGRFPAINILKSISRTMPGCNTAEENTLVNRARNLMATYDNMAEMIRLGAYRRGSDPQVDESIRYYEPLEKFLNQRATEKGTLEQSYAELAAILAAPTAAPVAAGQVNPPANPPKA